MTALTYEQSDLKHLFFVCFVNIIRWNAIVKPVIYKIDVNINIDYPPCDLFLLTSIKYLP